MIYIIRYGEIGLKGLNRSFFENSLVNNIKSAIDKKNENLKVSKKQGRIIVDSDSEISTELKRVFGIVNFSIAQKADSYEELKRLAVSILKQKNFSTFRVTVSRTDKSFEKSSNEVAAEIGELIMNELGKKVSLKEFDINLQIEISDKFYVFIDKIPCLGGLPVGVEGKVVCFMDNKESIAAAFLMMKRGCETICCGFEEFDVTKLSLYSPKRIEFIKIKNFVEVESILAEKKAKAIVVSDTIENLKDYETKTFIARPLVGVDADKIKEIVSLITSS